MTITEFLAARLDEDEAVAREVLDSHDPLPPWVPGDFGDPSAWQMGAGEGPSGYISVIVDAARALAEVAAKRAAIEAAWADHIRIEGEWGVGQSQAGLEALNDFPDVVRHLASVYADHPDYQAEWA